MSGYVNHEKCNPPRLLASFSTSSCSLEKLHEASFVEAFYNDVTKFEPDV